MHSQGNHVPGIPANQRQAIRSRKRLARSGHPRQNVGGQLPQVGTTQASAQGPRTQISDEIDLHIGLSLAGAKIERAITLLSLPGREPDPTGKSRPQPAAPGAAIPAVDQRE
jgi:hypothetical protein